MFWYQCYYLHRSRDSASKKSSERPCHQPPFKQICTPAHKDQLPIKCNPLIQSLLSHTGIIFGHPPKPVQRDDQATSDSATLLHSWTWRPNSQNLSRRMGCLTTSKPSDFSIGFKVIRITPLSEELCKHIFPSKTGYRHYL